MSRPVFLFFFANDEEHNLSLGQESDQIEKALQKREDAQELIFNLTPNATLDIIWHKINRFQNQIAIFHFGGHSNNQTLKLVETSLKGKSLAAVLGLEQNLQLVFLNGCSNSEQVALLFEKGIPAVIATSAPINDHRAIQLATEFYTALSIGRTIKDAFTVAAAHVNNEEKEVLVEIRGLRDERQNKEFEWGLYVNKKEALNWKITDAPNLISKELKETLLKNSKEYFDKLMKGRFLHLKISDLIRTELKTDFIDIEVQIKDSKEALPLTKMLQELWKRDSPHTVLLGEGGMGKTVSVIRLWQHFLQKKEPNTPIPIFISLNEYNSKDKKDSEDFIKKTIAKNYLLKSKLSLAEEKQIFQSPLRKQNDLKEYLPSILLFLDGFNELKTENDQLLLELKALSEASNGIQFVVTSRYDIGTFSWAHSFHKTKLIPLSREKIKQYLSKISKKRNTQILYPDNDQLVKLFANPMMLTIYADTSEYLKKYADDIRFDFKNQITSYSELMWNFIEVQVVKHFVKAEPNEQEGVRYIFLLRHLLSYLGWRMEKMEHYDFSDEELERILIAACQKFYDPDFILTYPIFRKYFRTLDLGQKRDFIEEGERVEKLKEYLCNELMLMVQEGENYRFLHQHFRDFFSARYILQEVKQALKTGKIPQLLKKRVIPKEVQRIMGEIEGEHYNKPLFSETEEKWSTDHYEETILSSMLERFRGEFDEEKIGLSIWNIIHVWNLVRGDLAGINLSNLYLKNINFNHKKFYKKFNTHYLSTNFSNSVLSTNQFFHQGSTGSLIQLIAFSPDGSNVASGAEDIKIWDLDTGNCLKTFKIDGGVSSMCYSNDGLRILSGSKKGSVQEWSIETEKKLFNKIHQYDKRVVSVCYNPNGEKLLSCAYQTIKEWDIKSGKHINTIKEEYSDKKFKSATYHPVENHIVGLFSKYYEVIVWDCETNDKIRWINTNFSGSSIDKNSLVCSPDGEKVIFGEPKKYERGCNIQEWSLKEEKLLRLYVGHRSSINSVKYNEEGTKIISGSKDGVIKVWSTRDGKCLQTFHAEKVHMWRAYDVDFSKDGRKVVAASGLNIEQWLIKTGERQNLIKGYYEVITHSVFNNDNSNILFAHYNGTIKQWNFEQQKCVNTIFGKDKELIYFNTLEFDHVLLRVYMDGEVNFLDCSMRIGEIGRDRSIFLGNGTHFSSAVVNAKSKKILFKGSKRNILKEYSLKTGELLNSFHCEDDIKGFRYSHDGAKVYSSDLVEGVLQWDCKYKDKKVVIPTRKYDDLIIHPKKEQLWILNNNKLEIWDMQSWKRIPFKFDEKVDALAFHPFENKFITSSEWKKKTKGNSWFSTSPNSVIKEWSLENGLCSQLIKIYTGSYYNPTITYSLDGKRILRHDTYSRTATLCSKEGGNVEFNNYIGMLIHGCNFIPVNEQSNNDEEEKDEMIEYGAIFNYGNEVNWKNLIQFSKKEIVDFKSKTEQEYQKLIEQGKQHFQKRNYLAAKDKFERVFILNPADERNLEYLSRSVINHVEISWFKFARTEVGSFLIWSAFSILYLFSKEKDKHFKVGMKEIRDGVMSMELRSKSKGEGVFKVFADCSNDVFGLFLEKIGDTYLEKFDFQKYFNSVRYLREAKEYYQFANTYFLVSQRSCQEKIKLVNSQQLKLIEANMSKFWKTLFFFSSFCLILSLFYFFVSLELTFWSTIILIPSLTFLIIKTPSDYFELNWNWANRMISNTLKTKNAISAELSMSLLEDIANHLDKERAEAFYWKLGDQMMLDREYVKANKFYRQSESYFDKWKTRKIKCSYRMFEIESAFNNILSGLVSPICIPFLLGLSLIVFHFWGIEISFQYIDKNDIIPIGKSLLSTLIYGIGIISLISIPISILSLIIIFISTLGSRTLRKIIIKRKNVVFSLLCTIVLFCIPFWHFFGTHAIDFCNQIRLFIFQD